VITEYLYLTPSGDIFCSLNDIRRYVEEHYRDRRPCPRCGCYLVPTGQTPFLLFRIYRCVNSICAASLKTFRLWPGRQQQAA
jgi:hypothetical protein